MRTKDFAVRTIVVQMIAKSLQILMSSGAMRTLTRMAGSSARQSCGVKSACAWGAHIPSNESPPFYGVL